MSAGTERARSLVMGRQIRAAVLWTLAAAGLLGLALVWIGPEEFWGRVSQLPPSLIPLVLGLSLVNYALRSVRWHELCRAMSVSIPFSRNALYYIAGFAFTVTPGKVGEVVRLWLLRREYGAAYERTVGLLVIDRITDAVPLLLLCLLGASRFAGHGWSVLAMAAFVLAGLILVLRPGWLALLVKLVYSRLRRRPRAFARILRLVRALRALVAPPVLGKAMCLGLLGWSAEVLGAWLVLHGLGAEIDLIATAFVFSFGMLVGGLPLFPGGVGGAEATMVALLLLLGVDSATAVAATALIRLATLGFALALGFLALPVALRAAFQSGAKPRPAALRAQL